MKNQPLKTNEWERIEELLSYQILDTPPEVKFDELTKLAAKICEAPISFVSLVDTSRQWFKSGFGNDTKETSKDISFCAHAILQEDILEIPDATLDPRFKNNPLVTKDPFIRFYAGAPLRTPLGFNLGTLCVIDMKPRSLNDFQKETLKILSHQVVELFQVRKLNQLLEKQQQLAISKAKMQSIGEMISGICHQINNPLAVISGRTMILKNHLSDELLSQEEKIMNDIGMIDATAMRIADIIRVLKMFAFKGPSQIEQVHLATLIKDTILVFKGKAHSVGLEIEEKIDSPHEIILDKNKMTYAFLILLNNAFEAIESLEDKKITIVTRDHSNMVEIDFCDNGHGVNPTIKDKIFEPFFTTRTKNHGVGLAQAKLAIEEVGGKLTLEKLRDPTIFRVTLPLMQS